MSLYIPIFTHCISRYPHFLSSLLSLALSFYLPLVLANNVDEYEIDHYAGIQSSRNLTVFASFERIDHDVASIHPAHGPPCILKWLEHHRPDFVEGNFLLLLRQYRGARRAFV